MTLWKVFLKNEIRRKTYIIRKNRKFFIISIYSLFLFWALYLGPLILDNLIPELLKQYSNMTVTILSTFVEYSFMILFLLYIMNPIFMIFRKSDLSHKEIILASPASPGDIFIGEFLGQVPFYSLFILGIGPFFSSLLLQLNPNLTFLHFFIFYVLIFTLLIFGLLIGTVIAHWLEHKITLKNLSKNLNYSILTLISLLLVTLFYMFHFLFDLIDDYPQVKKWISFYPSYWYSNIVLYIMDPNLIESYFLNIWASIGFVIIIPLLTFYGSYKKANFFYDYIQPVSYNSSTIKREKNFYRFFRRIAPKRYKNLVITQFKEFFRKKENLLKLVYNGSFTALFGFFTFLSLTKPLSEYGRFWITSQFIIQIFYFNYVLIMVLSWVGGLTFGIFVGTYVLMGSKDILFIYKKSVRGIKPLIFSFFFVIFFVILVLDILLTFFFGILYPLDILTALTFFFLYPMNSIIICAQAIGVQCFKPLFGELGKNAYINIYIIILLQVISLYLSSLIIMLIIPNTFDHSLGLIYILLTNIGTSFGIAVLLLFLGIRKLNHLE